MRKICFNIYEAISHFNDSEGEALCIDRYKREKVCKDLPEAKEFFGRVKPKKIRNKVRPIKTKK